MWYYSIGRLGFEKNNSILFNDYSDGTWIGDKFTEFNNYLSKKQLIAPYDIKTSIVGSTYNDQVLDIINITSAYT